MRLLPTNMRLLTAATAIFACLALVACGGDDDNANPPTATAPAGTPNASLDAGSVQQLLELSGKWADAQAKITYDFHSSSGSLAVDAQAVIYQALPKSRTDLVRPDSTTIVISDEDIGYSCVGSATGSFCTALPPAAAESAADVITFVGDFGRQESTQAIINNLTELTSAPDQSIAGEQAHCLKATGALVGIPGATATWCFSEEGLLLHQEFSGASLSFNMTATDIAEIQDSDFDPPYPVVTLPASPSASP